MKNKLGKTAGFVFGAVAFVLIVNFYISKPSFFDDDTPGFVILCTLAFGVIFSFIGSQIQEKVSK